MAKWVTSGVLDNGLNHIRNNSTRQLLIKAYAAGDSYATVVGNQLAEATMVSGDFTLSSSGLNRVVTTASGKTATVTANSGASPNLHIAFTDGSANVIWVTDETTDQVITSGNVVNFPSLTYTSNQPT
jgi:hypothetical protein